MDTAKHYPHLARIDSPVDLRDMTEDALPAVINELREYLIQSMSKTGGS